MHASNEKYMEFSQEHLFCNETHIQQQPHCYQLSRQHRDKQHTPPTSQKVVLRRRCRSECLQLSPLISFQDEKSVQPKQKSLDQTTNSCTAVLFKCYDLKQPKLSLKPPLLNPIYKSYQLNSSSHHQSLFDDKTRQLGTQLSEHCRLAAINRTFINDNYDITKKNILTPTKRFSSTPVKKGTEITDLRDIYLYDIETYDENADTNISLLNRQSATNVHQLTIYNGIEYRPSLETYKRPRARLRSETETPNISAVKLSSIVVSSQRGDNILTKRPRAKTTMPPQTKARLPSLLQTKATDLLSQDSTTICMANTPKKEQKNHQDVSLDKIMNVPLVSKSRDLLFNETPKVMSLLSPANDRYVNGELVEAYQTGNSTLSPEELLSDDSDNDCTDREDFDDDEFGEPTCPVDIDSLSDSEDSYKLLVAEIIDKKFADRKTVTVNEEVSESYTDTMPLSPSLFPHTVPYITFASHTEKGPQFPAAVQRILIWKLTTITPIVLRRILINSGFRLLKKTNDWMGIWGKHMKSPCFKTIHSYQKFNHIPGTFQIGRKDRIWRNLQLQMNKHGKKEFGFMPRTFIIPQDLKILRHVWPKYSQRNVKWIIKPPASARGTGIKVINRWSQIPKHRPLIVQRYIERPLLINGSKFDLRLYVLLTSINPLRLYMHTDGLARFASVKYSEKSDTLNDRFMHLTNYSINKLSANYAKNEDANACQGHKWTIKSLWTYLSAKGVNTERLWEALQNLVLRTILAGEGPIAALTKLNVGNNYNCYELFGIDVILDSDLVPWLLEVNISPSLHSASPLDLHVKGPLVRALLNTALYQVPPKLDELQQSEILSELGLDGKMLCHDKRLFSMALSKSERMKQNQFTSRKSNCREEYLDEILQSITPDDLRCLMITEDELARSAPLERIFPTVSTHKYLSFTEHPRYYNRLLDAWENRYGGKCRDEGIALLREMCEKKMHLDVPQNVSKDCSNKGNDELSDLVTLSDDYELPKRLIFSDSLVHERNAAASEKRASTQSPEPQITCNESSYPSCRECIGNCKNAGISAKQVPKIKYPRSTYIK